MSLVWPYISPCSSREDTKLSIPLSLCCFFPTCLIRSLIFDKKRLESSYSTQFLNSSASSDLIFTGTKPSGRCNILYLGVLFHLVWDTSVPSPLETWAGGLASQVLVWPDLLENSTLIQVKAGWLSPASPETDLHLPTLKFIFLALNKGLCYWGEAQAKKQGTSPKVFNQGN